MKKLQEYFEEYKSQLQIALNNLDAKKIGILCDQMEKRRSEGGRVFVLGNGGSAAAASHWVCDFSKGINTANSKRMKICSLADNLSVVTALGNDYSYDEIFREQLRNVLSSNDLVISLSVSGNSKNLLEAHKFAREVGAYTAAIIGDYNGKLNELSDLVITIPSQNYGVVEDVHMTVDHAISQYIKKINENLEAEG